MVINARKLSRFTFLPTASFLFCLSAIRALPIFSLGNYDRYTCLANSTITKNNNSRLYIYSRLACTQRAITLKVQVLRNITRRAYLQPKLLSIMFSATSFLWVIISHTLRRYTYIIFSGISKRFIAIAPRAKYIRRKHFRFGRDPRKQNKMSELERRFIDGRERDSGGCVHTLLTRSEIFLIAARGMSYTNKKKYNPIG